MRACFLLEDIGRSGGVAVALGHARRLAAEGAHVDVLLPIPEDRPPAELDGLTVRPIVSAADAYDVAIGTWWTTAYSLGRVRAGRRVIFLQSLEQRFYRPWEAFDRLGASTVPALPVDFVTVAGWMARVLRDLAPGRRCHVVPNGIDKSIFRRAGERRADGPLRILVEGQPEVWFKAVPEAVAAVRGMGEPATVTIVAPEGADAARLGADRVTGSLEPAAMAAIYAEHDVLLKLSRVEGLPLPPIEAMHMGTPCVATPFTGHEEYLRHGQNGFITGFDDPRAVSARLDLLARDRELLARLSAGALATSAAWPSLEDAQRAFSAAIRDLVAKPPTVDDALPAVLAALELGVALGRRRGQVAGWDAEELARGRALITELSRSREECADQLANMAGRLEQITSSRAYKVATLPARAARRLAR